MSEHVDLPEDFGKDDWQSRELKARASVFASEAEHENVRLHADLAALRAEAEALRGALEKMVPRCMHYDHIRGAPARFCGEIGIWQDPSGDIVEFYCEAHKGDAEEVEPFEDGVEASAALRAASGGRG